ncbi:VOC family protein [Hydrogenophaga sp.]|uniref:VOC family protein n=1 Tax=Hydrogenophaga sp. TaxID=1904254 RepID=UPI0035677A30
MTAAAVNSAVNGSRRPGVVAVHSVDRFVYSVPDLAEAQRFYQHFGLDVRRDGQRLDLYTFGHPHRWASIFEAGERKQLQYLRYGIFAEDEAVFRQRVADLGIGIEPHALGDEQGIWLRDVDGVATQLVVAPKVSPSAKTVLAHPDVVPLGQGAAPCRSQVQPVHPRALSHVLRFSPDVPRMTAFVQDVLGLRLSDKAADVIAFVHTPHGSDHHLVAFAQSHAPGLHHSSWEVGSIDEVGKGAEQMRNAGWSEGWGLGRHVLGSNYFNYVRDPWGSFCEYSCDIDFVPADLDWPAADHPMEDSLYVWGPAVPKDFVTNHEQPAP